MTNQTSSSAYRANRFRGPFNSFFFWAMDGLLNHYLRPHKRRLFESLPPDVVELGSGVGANFRYLAPGSTVIAIEPNPAMRSRLESAARRRNILLHLHATSAEAIDLADSSVDAVISSLVLCTVEQPSRAVAEVLRVLRPGGRYTFVEHVAARHGSFTARLQRILRRPWGYVFEGCSCERDLRSVIESAGFSTSVIEDYRIRSPFISFNTQIAGVATK